MNFKIFLPGSFFFFFLPFFFHFGHSSQESLTAPLMNDHSLVKHSRLAALEMEAFKLFLKTLDYLTLPFFPLVGQLNFSHEMFNE